MIEAIWPLSVSSCGEETIAPSAKRQQLLNLRTFVQEVLKRSKTSYSTLQVALYYLILIQSCLPKRDFTMEQWEDSVAYRAMQCGRRMFLAALILASKYLQDRNFSTRAWGKISGLRTCEINSNEGAFLSAIDWKLHVPKALFLKWENIVMNYSPAARVNGHMMSPAITCSWKTLVRTLTPNLDGEFPIELDSDSGYGSAGSDSGSDTELETDSFGTHTLVDMAPPPLPTANDLDVCSGSNEPTPTSSFAVPNATFKPVDVNWEAPQSVPQVPRMSFLPTPQLTPQTRNFSTPAVNANSLCFKKPFVPSMACAMAHIKSKEFATYNDTSCEWRSSKISQPFPTSARRSSLARSISTISSPESIVDDRSSRSSRSSSISSNASSNCALPQPRLAVEASRRCANMHLCGLKEESSQLTPKQPEEKDISNMSWVEFNEATYPGYKKPVIQILDQIMDTLPRARADGANADEEMRITSQPKMNNNIMDGASTQEAAAALSEMALSRQQVTPSPSQLSPQQSIPRPTSAKSLKRSRPTSVDLSGPSIHSLVRQQLSEYDEDESTVSSDETVADSFILRKEDQHNKRSRAKVPSRTTESKKQLKPSGIRDGPQRKRACAGSNRGARAEARMYERIVSATEQPGLWDEMVN